MYRYLPGTVLSNGDTAILIMPFIVFILWCFDMLNLLEQGGEAPQGLANF